MDHIRWSLLNSSVHVARESFLSSTIHEDNQESFKPGTWVHSSSNFTFSRLCLSSHQIGYPFHARRLIWTSPMQQRWSVFPRCTFRKEMVIYTHWSPMSLSACWNSFIINLFNTETRYDTPTRKSSFSFDGDAPEELHYPIRLVYCSMKWNRYHGQIFCSLQVKYMKRFEAGKVQPVFFLPKITMSTYTFYFFVRARWALSRLEVNN